MSKYILSIDQGTTGSRVNIYDKSGNILGSAYEEFEQHFPKPGWVEHDAEEIWNKLEKLLSAACQKAAVDAGDIAAIGITNQRETTVVWDKNGKPVHRAIVWQCRRTSAMCDELKKGGHSETFLKKTGLVIDAYFSGTKLAWILDNIDNGFKRAADGELMFGTIDSWLLYKLTGGRSHKTDYTNASRTLLFNIEKKEWDDELLNLLKIPRAVLPEVRPSADDFGVTSGLKDFPEGIPICAVLGDQQAALFGNLCIKPGESKNTYGTGCFMLMNLGDEFKISNNGLLTTLAVNEKGQPVYAFEGAVFIGGAVVQWLRDMVQFFPEAPESEKMALEVSEQEEEGLVFVPAFAGLGAPYWDQDARGAILGLTRGTNRAAITRAALKSIALQSYDLLKAMEEDSGLTLPALKVDGGATANNYLMQFQADVLDKKVERPKNTETTALGSAFLAGLHCGFWSSVDELYKVLEIDKTFEPAMPAERRNHEIDQWHDGVKRVLSQK